MTRFYLTNTKSLNNLRPPQLTAAGIFTRPKGCATGRANHRAAQGSVDRTMYWSSTLSSLGDSAALARNRPPHTRAILLEVELGENEHGARAPAGRLLLLLHCTAT